MVLEECTESSPGYVQGKEKGSTLVLEAIASYDLWIWLAFFGTAGACNDINVLDRSPLTANIMSNQGPEVEFTINGTVRKKCYWLADGIYPKWITFVSSYTHPETKYFAQQQEAVRKDVERAFGVLQARFHMISETVYGCAVQYGGRKQRG